MSDDQLHILSRIYFAWSKCPELRLGQFLENACEGSLFYRKDETLAEDAERFVERRESRCPKCGTIGCTEDRDSGW